MCIKVLLEPKGWRLHGVCFIGIQDHKDHDFISGRLRSGKRLFSFPERKTWCHGGLQAELDNAYAQKRQDNALESTVDAFHSVQRKEFSSRLRWTALYMNAARLGEVHFSSLLSHDHVSRTLLSWQLLMLVHYILVA